MPAQNINLYYALLAAITLSAFTLSLLAAKASKFKKLKSSFKKSERELKRKLYETAVLGELADKFSASLSMRKASDVVIGSLKDLIDYSTAAYLVVEGKKLIFRADIQGEIPPDYVSEVKARMVSALAGLTSYEMKNLQVEEQLTGKSPVDSSNSKVESFFNIPLTVGSEVVGLFNVSSIHKMEWEGPEVTLLYSITSRASGAVTKLHKVLKQERDKLEAMVESLTDGVFMVDKELQLLVINPACKKLLGFGTSKKVNIFDIVGAFSPNIEIEKKISAVFDGAKTLEINDVKVGKGFVDCVVIPVQVEVGVMSVGVLLHDRTKEKELERLKEDFIAMMIHELRSPLTVIRGTSDLLLKRGAELEDTKVRDLLEQMEKSAGNLLGIVNDLLDESKIEAGKFEVRKKLGDLNTLLGEEIKTYSNLARSQNLDFNLDLDSSVPLFAFDANKVVQVMNNLLSNAIKFTSEGTITVGSRMDSNQVRVYIADTGEGISEEMKPRLFNKFTQAHDHDRTKGPSTGLGLVICKGIVEAHGGKIWMEDNKPKGTIFTFTLPLSDRS